MLIIDFFYKNILSMGAWGNDIPLSDVDLSLNKVTSLLWYKKNSESWSFTITYWSKIKCIKLFIFWMILTHI